MKVNQYAVLNVYFTQPDTHFMLDVSSMLGVKSLRWKIDKRMYERMEE